MKPLLMFIILGSIIAWLLIPSRQKEEEKPVHSKKTYDELIKNFEEEIESLKEDALKGIAKAQEQLEVATSELEKYKELRAKLN